ncbi:gephyrin-like molybdotransferase receptor GlpR [Streptomyces graminilatus]|uniref:divisome protein SepX/GlpR n=1 Tax=Streptomyces graminilatus TaxID=1464070 RepID=UPI0006E395D3|nr:gephyrin-like molybdotransferase receptor GlpR [Streptomyces graminilatus]
MSSSGLIYAVIVGAWAAYLVPMWLRRQDELNEARPTERFSTAIRLLSGRAGMERRYAKDLRARSADEGEHSVSDPEDATDSVDVRAFAVPPTRPQAKVQVPAQDQAVQEQVLQEQVLQEQAHDQPRAPKREQPAQASAPAPAPVGERKRERVPAARRSANASAEAAARARRSKVLARRRRTTVMLFFAFTLGTIVAAVGGLAFLWAPAVPAAMLSGYIAYLRTQERRRFTYQMDRRQAELAAQRLRERQPRRRPSTDPGAEEQDEHPEPETDPGLSALAADRRALVEQTDHAEWVDQQRERQRRPGHGDSWDPVPVPLPTYVTAPVAPRATSDVDLGAPDAWSAARSSTVGHESESSADQQMVPEDSTATETESPDGPESDPEADSESPDGRTDARRAASARRARERGRTPLFDQYEDGERPRAANE